MLQRYNNGQDKGSITYLNSEKLLKQLAEYRKQLHTSRLLKNELPALRLVLDVR